MLVLEAQSWASHVSAMWDTMEMEIIAGDVVISMQKLFRTVRQGARKIQQCVRACQDTMATATNARCAQSAIKTL